MIRACFSCLFKSRLKQNRENSNDNSKLRDIRYKISGGFQATTASRSFLLSPPTLRAYLLSSFLPLFFLFFFPLIPPH